MVNRWLVTVCAVGAVLAATAASDAATRRVCASGCEFSDVQSAIDAAQPGDTILLRAGETFVGHYILRKKSGTGVILIRSDAPDSELPGAGVRLVPNTRSGGNTALNRLARLIGRGATYRTTPIFRTEAGASHYRLQFLQIDGSRQEGYETLLALGNNTTQTSASLAPTNLVLDRLYIHGDPVRGQKRCLSLDSASTQILNSYFEHCRHFAEDSQAIAGFNGPGPFRIENNYLEASTMSILFGGADPKTPNLVPSDIVIRRNYLTRKTSWRNPVLGPPGSPRATAATGGSLAAGTHYFKVVAFMDSSGSRAFSLPSSQVSVALPGSSAATISWSGVSGALRYRIFRGTSSNGQSRYLDTSGASTTFLYTGQGEGSGTPPTRATLWNVKNALELKNAQRVLIEGNVIENVWRASQNGYALVFTPRNQENTAPWTVVQDVTVQYNTIRHVNGGVNILGSDYSSSTGSQLTRRIAFRHNVWHDLGGSWGGGASWILITRGPSGVVVDHNTVSHTGNALMIDNGTSSGFVFTNNMFHHNTYGIVGSGAGFGTNALQAYFPGYVFRRNVLAGGSASLYPSDNYFPGESTFYSQFANYPAGDYRLVSSSLYLTSGTDGRPLGADIGTLQTVQGGGTGGSPTTNVAPTAAPGGPYSGVAGSSLAVSGTGSKDSDGTIASYRWSWGDGTADGSGATASHTYTQAGTYTISLTVTDNAGATGSATTTATIQAPTTSSPSPGDIVLTAQDVSVVRGNWAKVSSSGGAGGQVLSSQSLGFRQPDAPLAQPANYFEASFVPAPNTTYRVWLRLRSPSGSGDSVWVQFTGSVDGSNTPLWRAGTTGGLFVNLAACSGCSPSGWGWEDNAWWIDTPSLVRFRSAAPQTVRIQTREDGVQVDQIVLSPSRYLSTAPGPVMNDGTVLTRTGATLTPRDVVLRARDTVLRRGDWTLESDSGAADGTRLANADRGWATMTVPVASPAHYAEATFSAVAGVPYRVWLRLSALGNSNVNDSVWVQYSGTVTSTGQPTLRIGSTSGVLVNRERCKACGVSGWGWYASNWWNGQTGTVVFGTTGVQTIRIQPREDGVRIDQIVVSPDRYRSQAPGPPDNDTTILPY